MLLTRLRMLAFELAMLLYILYRTKVIVRIAYLRRRGRVAEVDALVERLVTGWCKRIFTRNQCHIDVEGREHIPVGQAFVVISNHQSKYDIPTLIAALGKPLGFVTKRELFRIPGLAFWMRQIHCMAIDRRDIAGGAEALATLGAELKSSGSGFVIFPEGTRTRDPDRAVQPFRRGALRLASEHDLPVLPIIVDGTRLLEIPQAMHATRHGGRHVRVRILPLQRLESNTAPARKALMDGLYETIRSNREAIRVEWAAN